MAFTYSAKLFSGRSNANPKTFSFTCAAGVRLLVLSLAMDGATLRSGGAPTYNGVALTQADQTRKAPTSPETSTELWYLIDPPTGSAYTISIPNSGSVYITAEASSYISSAGNKPALRLSGGNAGTGNNPPISSGGEISHKANDLVVAALSSGYDSWIMTLYCGPTASSGATSLYYVDDGTYTNSSWYYLVGSDYSYSTYAACSTIEDFATCFAIFEEQADLSAGVSAISKATGYSYLTPPDGANISKVVGYSYLSTETTISISKSVGYSYLESVSDEVASQPICFVLC